MKLRLSFLPFVSQHFVEDFSFSEPLSIAGDRLNPPFPFLFLFSCHLRFPLLLPHLSSPYHFLAISPGFQLLVSAACFCAGISGLG